VLHLGGQAKLPPYFHRNGNSVEIPAEEHSLEYKGSDMLHLSSKSWIFSKSPHSVYSLLESGNRGLVPVVSPLCKGRYCHTPVGRFQRGMAGRRVQEMINMLEGTDYSMMPYVVKKEAFHK